MSFADNVALFQKRFLANLPQASVDSTSVFMLMAKAFLSADADTQYMIQLASQNMYVQTATGAFLDARAADYGIYRNLGSASVGFVVFTIPQTLGTDLDIPQGTVVSTAGNSITNPAVSFITTSDSTITAGQLTSGIVQVEAQTPGVSGNVVAAAIAVVLTTINNGAITVTNQWAVDGASHLVSFVTYQTAIGIDADTDTQLRLQISAFLVASFQTTSIENAVKAIAGVYDCFVLDNGDGTINVYWCAPDGSQPADLVTPVQQAVYAVLPAGIPPDVGHVSFFAFVTETFSKITFYYATNAANLPTQIEPIIKQALTDYVNSLVHNQVPTQFGFTQFVNTATNYLLTNCYVDDITGSATIPEPLSGFTPADDTLWRASAWVAVIHRL